MAVFFFMSTALTATPVAPSLSSGLEFGRANWTAADHAAARASCRFVAGGRAYDLRALAGLTVVAELALGMESVGDNVPVLADDGRGVPVGARGEVLRHVRVAVAVRRRRCGQSICASESMLAVRARLGEEEES